MDHKWTRIGAYPHGNSYGLSEDDNYKKAYKFADAEFKNMLEQYNELVIYNTGSSYQQFGQFKEAYEAFSLIPSYKDVSSRIDICQREIDNELQRKADIKRQEELLERSNNKKKILFYILAGVILFIVLPLIIIL